MNRQRTDVHIPPANLKAVAGGKGGSWYLLMQGIASLVAEIYPQIQIEVVAGGGVINHVLIGSGEIPMGILNPPMTAAAIAGITPYTCAYPELRMGVANMTLNHLHFCVEVNQPFLSVETWARQKYSISLPVDRVGTVDRLIFQRLLTYLGISETDIERWEGLLIPAESYDEQLALYARGEVNALWQFMGIPSPSILAAHTLRPLKILQLPLGFIQELEREGWTRAEMPTGAYKAEGTAVPTVAMSTTLGFHASVADDVVYAITRVICDFAEQVRQIHPAAQYFNPLRAHLHGTGTLHAGASRYFQSKKVSPS